MQRLGNGELGDGLRNLTIAHGLGFVILVIFLFGYYAGYDLNLPFDNSLLPMICFAIVVLCGLPVPETPNDPLGPEQLGRRTRRCRCPPKLGQLVLGPRAVTQNVVESLAHRRGGARAEMAQRFLDEKTAGIYVAEVSVPANQRLKLTAAAILVFRASTSLQAAPAA